MKSENGNDKSMIGTTAGLISNGTITCSRQLRRDGTVMVFPGQVTDPTMVIACRSVFQKHFTINIKRALGLPDQVNVRDYLVINEGDFVSVGETIAQRSDRNKRMLIARQTGRFLGVSTGNLIFETNSEDVERVNAGFPGVVKEIVPNRGAFLETNGSFIQGVWGNGKQGQGILLSLDMEKGGIFGKENLSVSMSGSIVFANTCFDADVLQSTARLSPGGLIFGSLPSSLLPIAKELPFPVIVTDQLGIGRLSEPVHDILGENIIKCAYLYGVMRVGTVPGKPEIIIPVDDLIPERGNPFENIEVGLSVRIIEGFYNGEIGFVTELIPAMIEGSDASGKTEICDNVRVRIDEETEIVIPVTNVQIIRDNALPDS